MSPHLSMWRAVFNYGFYSISDYPFDRLSCHGQIGLVCINFMRFRFSVKFATILFSSHSGERQDFATVSERIYAIELSSIQHPRPTYLANDIVWLWHREEAVRIVH